MQRIGGEAVIMLERGDRLAGFTIERTLGAGAQGTVYLAYDDGSSPVALKVLEAEPGRTRKELDEFRVAVERFRLEAELAATLHHPNIVDILGHGDDGGQLWLAMRFIDGVNCEELASNSGLTPDRAVGLLIQASSGLDYAHRAGILHRDIKPANFLIQSDSGVERLWISDFGIARNLLSPTNLTATGTVHGTMAYMAPERILGGEVDSRADVYSLGCSFFRMITGKVPFPRDHDPAVMHAHIYEPPPRPSRINPAIPPALDGIIAKAMAKEPVDRYPDCRSLADAALQVLRVAYAPTRVGTVGGRPPVVVHSRPAPASRRERREHARRVEVRNRPSAEFGLLDAFRRRRSAKMIERLSHLADQVLATSPEMEALADGELREKTDEFRDRYDSGETLDEFLMETFAVGREASSRVLSYRQSKLQIMGAAAAYIGNMVEMKPRDSTPALILSVYLRAIADEGIHVVTKNEEVAITTAAWAGRVYHFLGSNVGVNLAGQPPESLRRGYDSEITYGTVNFGFDYLRAGIAIGSAHPLKFGTRAAVFVDGAGSLLASESTARLALLSRGNDPSNLEASVLQGGRVPDNRREVAGISVLDYFRMYETIGGISSEKMDPGLLKKNLNIGVISLSDSR
ncbi:protein kinase [Nocardia sp. NPDC051900]|uniref:protein kinase domain-containing protein n=1 Tax=Nocardia sp. NPDC051900 TaxID=3364326 RepID=UPI00379F2074